MLVLALALAAAAHGATVSVFVPYCAPEQSKYGACYPDEARFAAAPGEANMRTGRAKLPRRLTVRLSGAGSLLLRRPARCAPP